MKSIKDILREEDIEGLIQLGAPADEYRFEAVEIGSAISRTSDTPSERKILQILEEVWQRFFGPLSDEAIELRRGAFLRVARRIVLETRIDGPPFP